VPSIDEEHKIVETVRGLKDYTAYHFATEERHMSRLKFPALASHQAEHQLFVKTVASWSPTASGSARSRPDALLA
jgi:hemerythrin